jgi:hypothetical protein
VVAIVASFVSALLTEPLQVSRGTAFVRRSRSPVDEETLQQKLKSEPTHVINGSNRAGGAQLRLGETRLTGRRRLSSPASRQDVPNHERNHDDRRRDSDDGYCGGG